MIGVWCVRRACGVRMCASVCCACHCAKLSHFSDAFIRSSFTFKENARFYVLSCQFFLTVSTAHSKSAFPHALNRPQRITTRPKTVQKMKLKQMKKRSKKTIHAKNPSMKAHIAVVNSSLCDHNITSSQIVEREIILFRVSHCCLSSLVPCLLFKRINKNAATAATRSFYTRLCSIKPLISNSFVILNVRNCGERVCFERVCLKPRARSHARSHAHPKPNARKCIFIFQFIWK